MGCGGSKNSMVFSRKGLFPTKLLQKGGEAVTIMDPIYIFGGKKVLSYSTKANKISEVPITVELPRRTQCEYLTGLDKIATLGGTNPDKSISKSAYLLTPPQFNTPVKLPDFPIPIRYTTLAYFNNFLYAVGGQTTGTDPEDIIKDVYVISLNKEGFGAKWEKFCDLDIRRRSANLVVSENAIFVFAGYSGEGNRSTQIDRIDIASKKAEKLEFRLPLGVEGARVAWFSKSILFIGGKRHEQKPDANVLVMNFNKKAIVSVR